MIGLPRTARVGNEMPNGMTGDSSVHRKDDIVIDCILLIRVISLMMKRVDDQQEQDVSLWEVSSLW